MLKMRIMTAIVLICAVVFVIFYASPPIQVLALSVVGLAAAYEWLRLTRTPSWMQGLFYVLLLLCFCGFYIYPVLMQIALYVSLAGWMVALIVVIEYQRGHAIKQQNVWVNTLTGLWLIAPMWAGLYMLLNFDPLLMLFLLILVWSADICAYFSGRRWGKHLLASRVSPGKTWEGALGALVGTGIIIYIGLTMLSPSSLTGVFFILSLCMVPVSILGDLFESMIKRIYGVKDSGQLLPGHGGVLDRLDSLTAVAPIFALGYFFLLAYGN